MSTFVLAVALLLAPVSADDDAAVPLRVGFLVVDGVYNSELMAPWDIFHHTVFHTEPGMEVFAVSPDGGPVRSFERLEIGAHCGFDDHPEIDVLVVPSAEHSMDSDLENEALLAWVRKVGSRAEFLVSLCDGAFVLAAAGLLDGLGSTPFPATSTATSRGSPTSRCTAASASSTTARRSPRRAAPRAMGSLYGRVANHTAASFTACDTSHCPASSAGGVPTEANRMAASVAL